MGRSIGHVDHQDLDALYGLYRKAVELRDGIANLRKSSPEELNGTLDWDLGAADDIASDMRGMIQNIDNVSLT